MMKYDKPMNKKYPCNLKQFILFFLSNEGRIEIHIPVFSSTLFLAKEYAHNPETPIWSYAFC